MRSLIIPATSVTPGVWFEPGKGRLELTGNSIPEHASEFYQPVLRWIENVLPDLRGEHVLHMRLSYFNSTSLKALYQLMKGVKNALTMGATVRVRWYSDADDELIIETATMFSGMLELPMEIVSSEGNDDRVAV